MYDIMAYGKIINYLVFILVIKFNYKLVTELMHYNEA